MDASSSIAATVITVAQQQQQGCYSKDSDGEENHDDKIIFLHDKNGGLLNDIWTPNWIGGRIYY